MKKRLSIILLLALVAISCLLCACNHEHSFGDWQVETAATCTTDGVEARTCSCGEKETRPISATGHVYGEWQVETAATCTADGVEARTCSCSEKETRPISATGHDYTSEVKQPTCTQEGGTVHTCGKCGHTYTDNIVPTIAHNYMAQSQQPTCTEAGYLAYVCTVCGDVESNEVIPERGHVYGEWQVETAPSCTADGIEARTCSCGEKETRPVAAISHVDNNNDYICENCQSVFEKEIVVDAELNGTYDVTFTLPDYTNRANSKTLIEVIQSQIADFQAKYPGIVINLTVDKQTESAIPYNIIYQGSRPDMYILNQEMLELLDEADALSHPGLKAQQLISNINDSGAVRAATNKNKVVAYPISTLGSYVMYYDKSVVTNTESLEQIIADCEKAGKKILFPVSNAWHGASFFFATGCVNKWKMENGEYTQVTDTFNSPQGVTAMLGMQKLTKSSSHSDNISMYQDVAVSIEVVDDMDLFNELWGDNACVTDLPSFTVDGQSYHLGSYYSGKMIGVYPQMTAQKQAVLHLLAQYLSSSECQLERYQQLNLYPTNKIAQANEILQDAPAFQALVEQNQYSVPHRATNGSWWDIFGRFVIKSKNATSQADIEQMLEEYEQEVNNLLPKPSTWSVIGTLADSHWDKDLPMVEDPEGTWTSSQFVLQQGTMFKIRKTSSWDESFGFTYVAEESKAYLQGTEDGNCMVTVTGRYVIQFIYDGTTAVIKLIPMD